MRKTRVNKGERYYVLLMDEVGVYPLGRRDYMQQNDELFFEEGNYFHTKEEAEAMAEKIRKVLKGADVIEMPSEEDVKQYADTAIYTTGEDRSIHAYEVIAYAKGIESGAKWLKSKIVK